MYHKLVLKSDTSFEEAIQLLDLNGNGFLPIVDEAGKLVGIITDGDLRRAVLNNQFSLEKIINRNPLTASEGTSQTEIRKHLQSIHRRHMPVVNNEGVLVNVIILGENEFVRKENWVVIMAGGLGSRLGDLTKDIPKPMLEIGGKPILLGIIENFKNQGFYRFVICVNYKSQVIEDYFGDGSRFGVVIEYTRETKRMGTAGALSLVPFNMEIPFFVVNGDILTSLNYEDFMNFHTTHAAEATMCVKPVAFEVPFASVEFDAQHSLTSIKEKPKYDYFINTGLYIFNQDILRFIQEDTFYDMPTLFDELMINKVKVKVFRIDEYWLDVGRPEDFFKANQDSFNTKGKYGYNA